MCVMDKLALRNTEDPFDSRCRQSLSFFSSGISTLLFIKKHEANKFIETTASLSLSLSLLSRFSQVSFSSRTYLSPETPSLERSTERRRDVVSGNDDTFVCQHVSFLEIENATKRIDRPERRFTHRV